VLTSQAIFDRFWQVPVEFLSSLITMDKTWIHVCDPESKEQSKEWRQRFPASKEVQVQDTEVFKQGVGIFPMGQNGMLLVPYLEKGATITARYYIALLNKLKQHLVSKR
jgi:hypothetical protein